jgi:putative peptide zinc metalloprotease protein
MAEQDKKFFRVAVGAEPADRAISPLRTDLRITPQLFYGELCFVVKDPVTLRYYRLQPIEHFLIQQLDGKRTARDLLGIVQQQFPDGNLTVQDVLRFIGMLHESHLLIGEGVAHAAWLSDKAFKSRRQRMMQRFTNFLFLKVPLFHPDRLLSIMDRLFGRAIYSRVTGIVALLIILSGLSLVLSHTDQLANTPYSLFSWQNLLVLYTVFVITKVFHEFGHGLTCKHFGGEVSQMGVMLFFFTPSFYCDTSDAWMIPSRSARLWINAGGVAVELVLAALAAFIWRFTQSDTLINQIALNAMISCSVATLFFNANPLMRYDGYYFLADLMEIPNLMTKGWDHIKYLLQKRVLGLNPTQPPDANRLKFMVIYGTASIIYRWVVLFGIVLLLYGFFSKHGMGPIGVILAISYVVGSVAIPSYRAIKFLWKQRWDYSKRVGYISMAGCAAALLMLIVALLPWHMTLREPLVILSESEKPIFVGTPGYVDTVEADVGQFVHAGDTILTLRDPSLQTSLDQATSKRDEQLIAATSAQADNKPAELQAALGAQHAYEQQIAIIQKRIADLKITAPIDGVVVRDVSLKRITGNYLAPGMKLCRVVQIDKLQARMSLPQQQAALVRAGMAVKIRLWSAADRPIYSKVDRVSSTVSDQVLHPALSSALGGDLQVTPEPDQDGVSRTVGKRSTVVINLPPDNETFLADGMTGRAEITVSNTTVIGRLWRMILDTTTPDWHL